MICDSKIDMRDALFDEIYNIASKDKNVIFINADTPSFGLDKLINMFPNQYINTGVSEQSMILAGAGLALSGKKVFIYSLIPFIALRCYEFIKVNICSMNLPVTIIGAGAGLSFGFDGPTHHAICDIALMRTIPEITIYNISDSNIASFCVTESYKSKSPCYIRLDKGTYDILNRNSMDDGFSIIKNGNDACIISTGIMSHRALQTSELLKKYGLDAEVIDLYRVKPINDILLKKELIKFNNVFVIEENSKIGGIGSIILEFINDNNIYKNISLKSIALPDEQLFVYGSRDWLHKKYMLDKENIAKIILQDYIMRR